MNFQQNSNSTAQCNRRNKQLHYLACHHLYIHSNLLRRKLCQKLKKRNNYEKKRD